jgi:hypothetical protein
MRVMSMAASIAEETTVIGPRGMPRCVRCPAHRTPRCALASAVPAGWHGDAVVDVLCQAHLAAVAITITGGETVVNEAEHRSRGPKRDLVTTMQVLL